MRYRFVENDWMEFAGDFEKLRCTEVSRPSDRLWQISFEDNMAALNLECPWRLIGISGIMFGDEDHGQKFGLREPVDGPTRAMELIGESFVSRVFIAEGTGDLRISFHNRLQLEVFNNSSDYEGWSLSHRNGVKIVATGGGRLVIWGRSEPGS